MGCGLVAALLGWLILETDFKAFWQELRQLPLWLLPLLIVLQLLTQLLITYQWHQLTALVLGQSHFLKLLHIFTRGSVVEAVTPGAKIGGEAVRLYLLKQDFHCSTSQALSIIAMQKSISMSVLLSICLVSLLHIGRHIAAHMSTLMQLLSGALVITLVLAMMGLLFFARALSQWLTQFHGRVPQGLARQLTAYATATAQLSRGHWCLQFAISTVVWLLFPIKMVILSATLGVHLSFFVLLSVTMVSYMMGLFPFTPGGIGTFEGTMLALLTLLGVGYTTGLTITLVFRFVTFWLVILGSVSFVVAYESHLKFTGGHHAHQSTTSSHTP
ncbi:lysylphosphatidylglycerol synthase transmembrane domain-containing protein [Bengtsoniella intestinalis]|uniref:lysylphosphatidylglycerol synthase transmembrane domain-containing protein n=1 Tax=Bengtsoniella intestinalis TaxID=3073143 RepID=UPI00391F5EA5